MVFENILRYGVWKFTFYISPDMVFENFDNMFTIFFLLLLFPVSIGDIFKQRSHWGISLSLVLAVRELGVNTAGFWC